MPSFPSPFEPQDEEQHARSRIDRDKEALEEVRGVLKAADFYAYGRLDDQSRWCISVDDEVGRADVRIGDDGYEIELVASSPGLYADEESDWRRASRARLARIAVSNMSKGLLESHQRAWWDETEEGVAVSETWQLPFVRTGDIGTFIREHLAPLEALLTSLESRLD